MRLDNLPEPLVWLFCGMAALAMLLVCTTTIMVVQHFTAGPYHPPQPPPSCGKGATVQRVIMGNDQTSWGALVVCTDGVTLEH